MAARNTFFYYIHMLHQFIKYSYIYEFQYRENWFINLLNTLAWSALRLIYYLVVFRVAGNIGGWTYASSLVLAGTFLIVHSIYKAFFESNLNLLVRTIFYGELDFILTKPINSQFHTSLRRFTPRAFIRLFLGILIVLFGTHQLPTPIPLLHFIAFSYLCFTGFIIMYALSFIILTTAFWLGNVTPLVQVPQVLTSMSYMPYDIFGSKINSLIAWVIPLMFISTIPAKTLIQPQLAHLIAATFMSGTMLLLSHYFWRFGLRSYASASS